MIDKLYKIVKIVIGIFLAIFLGNKLFSFINVYAASTTSGTMTWTNTSLYNTSTGSSYTHNCPGSYNYVNNACSFQFQYPDQSTAKVMQYRFGFSDPNSRPYYVEANKTYKIILNVQGPLDYQNLTFNYVNVDDVSGAMVTPKSVSYANGVLIVTFSRTFNTYINSLFFYIPFTTTGSPGEWQTFSVGQSFSITDTTDTDDVIIDQNQIIIDQNKETNEKLDKTNDNLNDLKEQEKETYDYLTDESQPSSDISSLGNVQGLLPPGPVDSLLNIPFKFLSVVNSSFGGVCKPLEGPFVYDSTLTLPCFSEVFYDEVPPLLLNFLSLIPASWILISYFKHLYKKVNRAVSMETNADDEWGVL